MSKVTPYTTADGLVVYHHNKIKVVLDPKNDKRFQQVDEKVNRSLYITDHKDNFLKDENGKFIFREGIKQEDVIKTVHSAVHEVYGEYDKIIGESLKNGPSSKAMLDYRYSRDGDPSRDKDGDDVANVINMPKDTLICTEFSSLEHHFLTNNGVDSAEFTCGTVAFSRKNLDKKDGYHAWVTINNGDHVIETTSPSDPILHVKNSEAYNKGVATSAVDNNGQQVFYSTSTNYSKAYDKNLYSTYLNALNSAPSPHDFAKGALSNDMITKNKIAVAQIDTNKPFNYVTDPEGGSSTITQGAIIIDGESMSVNNNQLMATLLVNEKIVMLPDRQTAEAQIANPVKPESVPDCVYIKAEHSEEIASILKDDNKENDVEALSVFVTCHKDEVVSKDLAKAIIDRAKNGFTDVEMSKIRNMYFNEPEPDSELITPPQIREDAKTTQISIIR